MTQSSRIIRYQESDALIGSEFLLERETSFIPTLRVLFFSADRPSESPDPTSACCCWTSSAWTESASSCRCRPTSSSPTSTASCWMRRNESGWSSEGISVTDLIKRHGCRGDETSRRQVTDREGGRGGRSSHFAVPRLNHRLGRKRSLGNGYKSLRYSPRVPLLQKVQELR